MGRWSVAVAVGASCAVALLLMEASKRRARRRRRRLAIRVASPYAQSVLREAAAHLGIMEDAEAPFEWADFGTMQWDRLLSGTELDRRASCLYLRAGLVRKGMLAHRLLKRKVQGVLPESIVADVEDEEDLDSLRQRLESWTEQISGAGMNAEAHPTWVAKASCSNRGEHIFVANTATEVADLLRPVALGKGVVEWVVQRYVAPPVLIGGMKFHVRAHLLVSGCPISGVTRAWLHSENHVVLVSGTPYSGQCSDHLAHMTNHCVQVNNPQYDEDRQTLLLAELDDALGRAGVAAHVQHRMEACLADALSATASAPAGFGPLPQCFELFGADFVLEDCGSEEPPRVWLLEVNAGPDLAVFGERLRPQCVKLIEDVLSRAVEPYFDQGAQGEFVNAESCSRTSLVSGAGFSKCLWEVPPKTTSAVDELLGFKRRVSIAGNWAKALHESSGVAIRGPQGEARS